MYISKTNGYIKFVLFFDSSFNNEFVAFTYSSINKLEEITMTKTLTICNTNVKIGLIPFVLSIIPPSFSFFYIYICKNKNVNTFDFADNKTNIRIKRYMMLT